MVQNQFRVKLKNFMTDNAKDYFNQILSLYFQSQDILHESSCVNTTQALLFQGNVPKSYWGEVVLTATYLINRILSRLLDNKSPVKVLKSFYPHFITSNGLTPRIFGCTTFVHVYNQHRDKLDP